MKNLKKNALILLAITFVVLFFVLKDDFPAIVNVLKNVNILYLLIAVGFVILYWVFKSLAFYIIVKKDAPNFTFKAAFQQIVITQFFNGITPFSTGGQPMQIYMLKQKNIRIAKGTNIIIQDFIFYQIALVLFGIFAIITNRCFHYFDEIPLLKVLILIGFAINFFVLLLLVLISFSNKMNQTILNIGVNILSKLKLVKDKEVTLEKWNEKLTDFHASTKELKNHKVICVKGIIYNILGLICYYIIPLFIAFSIHDFVSLNILSTLVASAYVLIIGSFVPIPGASGGIEYGFMAFFGVFMGGANLSAVLLLWRTVTYYLGMIIGAIFFSLGKGLEKCV